MDVKVVLLDIEGTVCPVSFVKDVLFPYALQVLPQTLLDEWDTPSFTPYRDAFPPEHRSSPAALTSHVRSLMAQDLKLPALKSLQGYLWQRGYQSAALRCPLFPDVHPSLLRWRAAAIPILIYSSGSVPAQKLLFQHTDASPEADLRPLLDGYFDTLTAGPKLVSESYVKIARTRKEDVGEWLFLSDNVGEVRAAREAGMRSFVVVREGNAVLSEEEKSGQVLVRSFDEVDIRGVGRAG